MLWFAAALLALLVGGWCHQKATGTLPRTLLGGEFKERVLELAQQAGVKINQILLVPAQQLQMGNAFAVAGSRVMITDYLLERLTKKETDGVMAHEIGHIKHHHTLLLSLAGISRNLCCPELAACVCAQHDSGAESFGGPSDGWRSIAIENWLETYLLFPVTLLAASLFEILLLSEVRAKCGRVRHACDG